MIRIIVQTHLMKTREIQDASDCNSTTDFHGRDDRRILREADKFRDTHHDMVLDIDDVIIRAEIRVNGGLN